MSAGVVGSMLARAAKVGLTTWGEVEMLDDAELDEHLHGRTLEPTRPLPDCAWIHAERSKPGVPLQLLWNSPCTRGWTGVRLPRGPSRAGSPVCMRRSIVITKIAPS